MHRLLAITVFLIGAALIFFSLRWSGFSETPLPETQRRSTPVPSAIKVQSEPAITSLPIASDATTSLGSPDSTAEDDLSTLELLLTTYARHHHGNPVGENVEISAALLGKNPTRVAYLKSGGSFINASGQLIDRWGTPYFFHQLSAKQTEIRSAGPDRDFHTADDLVR